MSYKTRTAGTARPTRDLSREVPLGILTPNKWHDVKVTSLSVSPTSVVVNVADTHGDKLDTRIFIHEFSSPSTLSTRMKAFLSAVSSDSNELMTLADQLLDGEFHVLDTVVDRQVKCKAGFKGDDIDIVQFNKVNKPIPAPTGSFFND